MNLLNTFFIYMRLMFVCSIFCPLLIISFIILPSFHSITSYLIHYGSKAILWALGIPISIQGAQLCYMQPSIIIANHQSIIDIPLVAATISQAPYQWLYKHQLNNTPLIGRWFNKIGIAVSFSSFNDGLQVLRSVCKKIAEYPYNLIIFPEGARFVDGAVHQFLPGFALLAQKLSYPVQPLYIHNAGRVCPPGSFSIHYTPVKITLGPVFVMAPQESVKEFGERVYQWFLKQQACADD